jgi:hypothetical protein
MRQSPAARSVFLLAIACAHVPVALAATVDKPAALVADGIPPVPQELADKTRPYMEFRTAAFESWNPIDRSILITTRFANTAQVHQVKMPGGARTQLSFEADRIIAASWAPSRAT